MENFQILQNMKPEELQELLQIYRAKIEGQDIGGQMHKPVMVNTMEESLLASLPNTTGHIDPMTGLRSYWTPTAGYAKNNATGNVEWVSFDHLGYPPPGYSKVGGPGVKTEPSVGTSTKKTAPPSGLGPDKGEMAPTASSNKN